MRSRCLILFLCILFSYEIVGQERVLMLSADMFKSHDRLFLAPLDGWIFKNGHHKSWADVDLDVSDWEPLKLTAINASMEDASGRLEGWFRLKIVLDESLEGVPLALNREMWAATDVYIDGALIHSFGNTGNPYRAYNPVLKYPVAIELEVGKEYLLAVHFVDYETTFTQRELRLKPRNLQSFVNLTGPAFIERVDQDHKLTHIYGTLTIAVSCLLFLLFCFLVFLNPSQKTFQFVAVLSGFMLITSIGNFYQAFFEQSYVAEKIRFLVVVTMQPISTLFGLIILEWVLTHKVSLVSKIIFIVMLIVNLIAHVFSISLPFGIVFTAMVVHFGRIAYVHRSDIQGANLAVVAAAIVPTFAALIYINIHKYSLDLFYEYDKPLTSLLTLSGPLFLLIFISIRFKEVLDEVSSEAEKVLKVTEEKKEILANQNVILEQQVVERTTALNQSLEDLKSTQSQLIHSEKMASLGELTAGIAHEIQNPLNFVNNFSDLNRELLDEQLEELKKGELEEAKDLAKSIKENECKITHHGKRAEQIVKSMLQHSRTSSGEKELTDLNALCDEYLNLAYHGMRAKDKNGPMGRFNSEFELDLDPELPKVEVVPQDMGRVLLNLINNAFQAVAGVDKPKVIVSTKYLPLDRIVGSPYKGEIPLQGGVGGGLKITISDNGPGIPDDIKEKIFQPFFTTKPTGEGTGLGLSMSYDIITKGHGGTIEVESTEGSGTEFIITLPHTDYA